MWQVYIKLSNQTSKVLNLLVNDLSDENNVITHIQTDLDGSLAFLYWKQVSDYSFLLEKQVKVTHYIEQQSYHDNLQINGIQGVNNGSKYQSASIGTHDDQVLSNITVPVQLTLTLLTMRKTRVNITVW